MKHLLGKGRIFAACMMLVTMALVPGVSGPASAATEEGGIKKGIEDYLFEKKAFAVVEDYTENTVLKTIALLVEEIDALNTAAGQLEKNQTEANMAAVTEHWKGAMAMFNRHWVFNYGPAAHYDFHKQLATWPVDKVWVDHYLQEIGKKELKISAQFLRHNKHSSTRGLHTAAYLLFREGKPRAAKELTPAELSYLKAVSEALVIEGTDFLAAWQGTANLPPQKRSLLKDAGIKERPAFAEEFTRPGEEGSRFASISIPLQEIFQESTTVIEDMMAGFDELAKAPGTHHYWDRIDPYADAINMLKGVENSYLGGVEGARGTGLCELVAKKNQVLDRRIKTSLVHAVKRIEAVRDLSSDTPAEMRELMMKVALSECEKLFDRLSAATPLVTADSAVNPWAAYGR